jgi:hypothetical protein
MDDDETKGWGKFKAIVKALAMWIIHIILKAIAVLLKIAIAAVVFTVKTGAILIDSLFSFCGVTTNGVKNAVKYSKARKEDKKLSNDFVDEDDEDAVNEEIESTYEKAADEYMSDLEAGRANN